MSRTGPLAGTTVVDLTRALAGPQATMLLGDLGAYVIKVEQPGRGDETRGWGPPFVGAEGERPESTYFLSANRNKQSIALDLKQPADAELLRRLIAAGDVLVENFRPGVLDRLGFSVAELHALNPRLVVLSITGFGHDGPDAGRAGYDQIAQGEAGLMSITGSAADDPQKVGAPIADLLAGIFGAQGVLAALLERERTGRGRVVRTSLLAAVVAVHGFQGTRWTVAGELGTGVGNHHPAIAPYGLFRCGDGAVQIAAGNDQLWARLCDVLGLDPTAAEFATNADRVARQPDLIRIIEDALRPRTSVEVLAALRKAEIPAGEVKSLDAVYSSPQTRSQRLLVDVDHRALGRIVLPGNPLRFFELDTGAETTPRDHDAPPLLDGDRAAVQAWLDRSEDAP
ncbi:CaiB/BaiF CoA transferase family protein [Pseudonocardia sp. TRM90224]|uniref:CaiB/BaiF CoA transferase family protein n=1 Tax=Pseudonocardia sp. TRM90224 TaxID=2812678 RepID=UPI001E31E341|nr:CoA transferase [Pseudonocardia sp. TRM90224]